MSRYVVTVEETVVSKIKVDANNVEEAKLKAEGLFFAGQYDLGQMIAYDITNIEEE